MEEQRYTIRQRIGPLLMRMQKRYGKIETSNIKLIRTDTTLDLSQKAEKGRDGGTYMLDQLIRLESDYVPATSFSIIILSIPFLFVVKSSSDVGSEASKEGREKGEG
ncbi:hypothetical protein QL285_071784 [Trifolium repens]|nr:hypothetical protein QL285_071784 [Trifolium repens]